MKAQIIESLLSQLPLIVVIFTLGAFLVEIGNTYQDSQIALETLKSNSKIGQTQPIVKNGIYR